MDPWKLVAQYIRRIGRTAELLSTSSRVPVGPHLSPPLALAPFAFFPRVHFSFQLLGFQLFPLPSVPPLRSSFGDGSRNSPSSLRSQLPPSLSSQQPIAPLPS